MKKRSASVPDKLLTAVLYLHAVLPPLASSLASVPIEEMALDLDAADYSFTSLDGGMLKLPPRLLPGTQSPAVSSCTGIILHPTSARGDEV